MRLLLTLFLTFLISIFGQAQEINYGLSISSAIELVSDAEKSVQVYNEYYSTSDQTTKQKIWFSNNLYFDAYYKERLRISIGFATFSYRYKLDSVHRTVFHGSLTQPGGVYTTTHYGYSQREVFTLLPAIRLGYDVLKSNQLILMPEASFGFPMIYVNSVNRNTAYDASENYILELNNEKYSGFNLDKSIMSMRLGIQFGYSFNKFSVLTSPSFFHYRSISSYGKDFSFIHNSLQLSLELSYRL